MNKRLLIFTLFITCVYTTSLFAQDRLGVYAAAFYNLENLWDTVDDPNNEGDDDFTPEGKYEWTQTKYEQKLQNIAKVISQLGRDYCPAGPAIIGISEVENRKVLEDLTKTAPISGTGYEIVHFESPDHRGIDVAALYNPKLFKLIDARTYPFNKPDMPHYNTGRGTFSPDCKSLAFTLRWLRFFSAERICCQHRETHWRFYPCTEPGSKSAHCG